MSILNLESVRDNLLRITSSFTKTQGEKLWRESYIKEITANTDIE